MTPRRMIRLLIERLGLVLILFGAALLAVGGTVQAARWWRVAQAERQGPPDYAASLLPPPAVDAMPPALDAMPPGSNVLPLAPIPADGLAQRDGTRTFSSDPEAGGTFDTWAGLGPGADLTPTLTASALQAAADATMNTTLVPATPADPKEATVAAALSLRALHPGAMGAIAAVAGTAVTETPAPAGPRERLPDRIIVPGIELDKSVTEIGWQQELVDNDTLRSVWEIAANAVGFHRGSAPLGRTGNTVVSGHNNIDGAVFARLHELEAGDRVYLYSGEEGREYEVWASFVVREEGVPLEQRLQNAAWIGPSPDERLTMVTCYPPWGNSHRTIVVARPIGDVAAPPPPAGGAQARP